jgi:hypothetical protein
MIRRLALAAVCGALVALASPVGAAARPAGARLDPSYGTKGVAMTSLGIAGEEADARLSLGPDGTALVADGVEGTATRFGARGSWDTHFGKGGRLAVVPGTAFSGRLKNFSPASITIDGKGRVVAFGGLTLLGQSTTNQAGTVEFARVAAVVRFAPDGRHLDSSFGEGKGYVEGDFGLPADPTSGLTKATAVTGIVDSSDRPLFLVGSEALFAACEGHGEGGVRPEDLVRLTESGALDTSFGGGAGISPIGEAGNTRHAFLGLAEADQPVIGVGRPGDDYAAKCGVGTIVQRFGSAGEPSASFGPGGTREFSTAQVGLVEPSGTIMLVEVAGRWTLKLAAIGSDGAPEPSFGQDGVATVKVPDVVNLHVEPVGVDSKGRLVIGGIVTTKKKPDGAFAAARFLLGG